MTIENAHGSSRGEREEILETHNEKRGGYDMQK